MLNLVISGLVIGKVPVCFIFKKNGITLPFDPITFPYLTTENLMEALPLILFAAIKSLSDVSLVAPYRLIGAHALSVDNATTFFTEFSRAA